MSCISIDTSTLNFDPSKTMATPVKGVTFQPLPKLRAWQNKMEALLLKQRRKGGVIDTSQSDVIDGTWVIRDYTCIRQLVSACRHIHILIPI